MATSGAADAHGEIAAILLPKTRQEEVEQPAEPFNQGAEVGLALEECQHLAILARLRPQAFDEVRIGQKADVEQQIGAERNAALEAEAHQ